ncbi:MAG: hypothetical protein B5766_08705 [Candidatus Lumbricidophila eiseniae]|uniref:Uncharacterized protein n=1 Tax=Candidatus Lumbricidiphila eiseniae TaxID=1969409 RepID=A0A2A6FQ89_9MICO|nr:MAG: hypothetical protein B5766_08705 [Candidatus Lumbricidophila eiseniae]
MKKFTIIGGIAVAELAASVLTPMAATADTPTVSTGVPSLNYQVPELADSLSIVFEEVVTFDSTGPVPYNTQRTTELLGIDKAQDL